MTNHHTQENTALRARGVLACRQALENREKTTGLACTHAGQSAAHVAGEATEYNTALAGIGWHAASFGGFHSPGLASCLKTGHPRSQRTKTTFGATMIIYTALREAHPLFTLPELEHLAARYRAVEHPPAGESTTFTNTLDTPGVVRTVGLVTWGASGRLIIPTHDATSEDRYALFLTAATVFLDLRRAPRDLVQPSPLFLYKKGYTKAVYPARFLTDDDAAMWHAIQHGDLHAWEQELTEVAP